jgi:hypothetical protein
VAKTSEVTHEFYAGARVVGPYCRAFSRALGPSKNDRRKANCLEMIYSRVVKTNVNDENAIDATLCPPASMNGHLRGNVVDDLEREGDGACREFGLDTGN